MAQQPEQEEKFLEPKDFREKIIDQLKPLFEQQGWKLRPFRQANMLKKLPQKEIWWCIDEGRFNLPTIWFKVGNKHFFRVYPRNTTRINGLFDFIMGMWIKKDNRKCQIEMDRPYNKNEKYEYCSRCFYHLCLKCKENLRIMTDEQGKHCTQCPQCKRPFNILPPNYF